MLSEDKIVPYHSTDLTGRRVLVLAPHPDDETIGCGGSLLHHVNAGDPVKVVFLTNGAKGDSTGRSDPDDYTARRRQEAEDACAMLGIADYEFWPFEDRQLAAAGDAPGKLAGTLLSYRPELVYAPSPFEFHPDHRAAAFLLMAAIESGDVDFEVAFYEVNQPLKVNCLVDITGVAQSKYAALSVYASQLKEKDFTDISRALNRFRSLTLPDPAVFAEAFYLINSAEIRKSGFIFAYHQDINLLFPDGGTTEDDDTRSAGGSGSASPERFGAMNFKKQDKQSLDRPLVSVIIPTYNRKDLLRSAVESVLAQSYPNFEVIVVNDGGEDIADVIDTLNAAGNIRYLAHEERRDVAAARNTALKAASGAYIAYLDDDDIYYPDHLETMVEALEKSDCPLAYSDANRVTMNWITDRYVATEKRVVYSHDFDRDKLLVSNYIPTLNIVHRRDLLDEIGYFDETLPVHEDWDLWIRAAIKHDFCHVKKTTAEFSVRATQQQSKSAQKIKFLDTIRCIHDRYAHLVHSPKVAEGQKRAQRALALELKDQEKLVILNDYRRYHFYRFARQFGENRSVLDLNCGDGTGSYLLSQAAASVVGTDRDNLLINRAGSTHIRENLRFVSDYGDLDDMGGEKPFEMISCYDAFEDLTDEAERFIGKAKEMLAENGIFILSVANRGAFEMGPGGKAGVYLDELRDLLSGHFQHVRFWGLNVFPASIITAYFGQTPTVAEFAGQRTAAGISEADAGGKKADAFVAVASDAEIPVDAGSSYFVDTAASLFRFWETYVNRLDALKDEKQLYIDTLEAEIESRKAHSRNLQELLEGQQQHASNLETELSGSRRHARNLESELQAQKQHAQNLEVELSDQKQHGMNLEKLLDEAKRRNANLIADKTKLDETIYYQKAEIERLSVTAEERSHRINALEATLADRNQAVANFEAELSIIRSSLAWRLVEGFRRRMNWLFPESSRRRGIYLKLLSGMKIYLNNGFFALLRETRRKFRRHKNRYADTSPAAPADGGQGREAEAAANRRAVAEFCPVQAKRIADTQMKDDSDMQMISEKLTAIKDEMINDYKMQQ